MEELIIVIDNTARRIQTMRQVPRFNQRTAITASSYTARITS